MKTSRTRKRKSLKKSPDEEESFRNILDQEGESNKLTLTREFEKTFSLHVQGALTLLPQIFC